MPLPQYSPAQLVYICAPRKSRLYDSVAGRIWGGGRPEGYLTEGERAVIDYGWRMEVCWAETRDSASAQPHKAELLREYDAVHGRLPGFERPDNRGFVRGNKNRSAARGNVGALSWSAWHPMEQATVPFVPVGYGVYCIRALRP